MCVVEHAGLLRAFALLQKDKLRCILWWTFCSESLSLQVSEKFLHLREVKRLPVNDLVFVCLSCNLQAIFLEVLFKKLAKYAFRSVLFLNSYRSKIGFENKMTVKTSVGNAKQ